MINYFSFVVVSNHFFFEILTNLALENSRGSFPSVLIRTTLLTRFSMEPCLFIEKGSFLLRLFENVSPT